MLDDGGNPRSVRRDCDGPNIVKVTIDLPRMLGQEVDAERVPRSIQILPRIVPCDSESPGDELARRAEVGIVSNSIDMAIYAAEVHR